MHIQIDELGTLEFLITALKMRHINKNSIRSLTVALSTLYRLSEDTFN